MGFIYKLITEKGIYIGSTRRKNVVKRINEHLSDVKYPKKCTSSLILKDAETIEYEILEAINDCDIPNIKDREAYHILQNPECVNKCIPLLREAKIKNKQYDKIECPTCKQPLIRKSLLKHNQRKH